MPYSSDCSFFVFQIFCKNRDKLLKNFKSKNIGTSIHYATPLPLMTYYKKKYQLDTKSFKNSKKYASTNISLPIYPSLKKFEINIDRVPHIGWNKIKFKKQNKIFDKDLNNKNFYFVHSYYCKPNNKKSILSSTKYNDVDFCSSILEKNILATQFHPEKSGKYGLKFLKKIIRIL